MNTRPMAVEHFGPALSDGSRPFRAAFGDDEYLLALVNEWMEEMR